MSRSMVRRKVIAVTSALTVGAWLYLGVVPLTVETGNPVAPTSVLTTSTRSGPIAPLVTGRRTPLP